MDIVIRQNLTFALIFIAGLASADPLPFEAFEPTRKGHSWRNDYLLAVASEAAHRRRVKDLPGETYEERFETRFAELGLELITFVDRKEGSVDTQALVLRNDRLLLVAFMGSEAVSPGSIARDWIGTNSSMALDDLGDGVLIHRGFHRALDLVYDDLREIIEDELSSDRRLWLTGHSLGGALASIAAYRLSLEGVPVQGVVGFATPMIGDAGWSEAAERELGKGLRQWAVRDDPIPRLPIRWGDIRYVPAGTLNVIGEQKVMLDGELDGKAANFADHRMSIYLSGIYYGMPKRKRRNLPLPPDLCPWGSRVIALHPETEYAICKRRGAARLSSSECRERGGQIIGEWCAVERQGKRRYKAYRLEVPPRN